MEKMQQVLAISIENFVLSDLLLPKITKHYNLVNSRSDAVSQEW